MVVIRYLHLIDQWESVLSWSNRHGERESAELATRKLESLRKRFALLVLPPLDRLDRLEACLGSPLPVDRLLTARMYLEHVEAQCSKAEGEIPVAKFWLLRQQQAHRIYHGAVKSLLLIRELLPSEGPPAALGTNGTATTKQPQSRNESLMLRRNRRWTMVGGIFCTLIAGLLAVWSPAVAADPQPMPLKSGIVSFDDAKANRAESRAAVHVVRIPAGCLGPDVAVDAQGVLHMVYARDRNAYYLRSPDNGTTFSEPVQVNREGTVEFRMGERGPKLAVGSDGTIHVATPQNQSDEIYPTAVANRRGEVLFVWQIGPMSTTSTATIHWACYKADGAFTGRQDTLGKTTSGTKATAFVGTDDNFYVVTVSP